MAGDVRIGDRVFDKPGAQVPADTQPVLRERPRYVSRGGDKLAGALAALGIDVRGRSCLDAGASTGGFTDCLLQSGARSVVAVDVGYGQFALSLREDPRVRLIERTNFRHFGLSPELEPVEFATADLSFISLTKVLHRLREWTVPGGQVLVMVKPQFELARHLVGSRGVVRDPELREQAVQNVRSSAAEQGLEPLSESDSVLPGPKGNLERFLLLQG